MARTRVLLPELLEKLEGVDRAYRAQAGLSSKELIALALTRDEFRVLAHGLREVLRRRALRKLLDSRIPLEVAEEPSRDLPEGDTCPSD
jgi:hypothetical protein